MQPIRPNTQQGRILAALADGHWHGGPDELGHGFHTAAQRISELNARGFVIESRQRRGRPWWEYQLIYAPGEQVRLLPAFCANTSEEASGQYMLCTFAGPIFIP